MSIRRTQQTVQHLWRAMEAQLPPPTPHHAYHSDYGCCSHPNSVNCNRVRASPPLDPELGNAHDRICGPPPELVASGMQPPRLPPSGFCSRLAILTICCVCAMVTLVACTVFLSLPIVVEARAAFRERLRPTPIVGPTAKRRPLPAILHRYGTLRRAQAPASGIDHATLRAAFPHWRANDGSLAMEAVVGDIALGLAAVVEQLDRGHGVRVASGLPRSPSPLSPLSPLSPPSPPLPPSPPSPSELPSSIVQSEEETEL